MRKRQIRIEFKIQDCWIGAFWNRGKSRLDVWVCVLPMVPVHYISWVPADGGGASDNAHD